MGELLARRRKLLLDKKEMRKRKWVRDINKNRVSQGDFSNLVAELRLKDEDGFFNYFRMTPEIFDYLLSIVGSDLERKDTNFRKSISSKERLSMTLRYLASGDSMRSIAYSYRVGFSTVSGIVKDTCESIWTNLQPLFLPVPTADVWVRNYKIFSSLWNFPNCVGAIDGKHVAVQSPQRSGSMYYNYKHSYSIVLLAVVDPTYCYSFVDIGAYGKSSDGSIFANSQFGQKIEDGSLELPPDIYLPGTTTKVPVVFVGDEAFPLKTTLMRPYPGRNLTYDKSVFNYRLSRARRIVENAFGITASRWRILRKPIIASVETATAVTKAVVCLHNFVSHAEERSFVCRKFYMGTDLVDTDVNGVYRPGEWRREGLGTGLRDIGQMSSNNSTTDALNLRNKIKNYFVSADGSLPYQASVVNRGSV